MAQQMKRSKPTPITQTGPDENMSTFFDFGSPSMDILMPHDQGPIPASQLSPGDNANRGGIRVSLACVPCRSRHVKCGAETPSCARCQDDGKQCFYAKSRRGMRDRNAPAKRSGRDALQRNPSSVGNVNLSYHQSRNAPSLESYTRQSSEGSTSPASQSSRLSGRQVSTRSLLELYYAFFHKAHPYLLPRNYFLSRLETDPEPLQNLLPAMRYIGSLYTSNIPSAGLREAALKQLGVLNLPPNGFTVQALLIMAIATVAEDDSERARHLLDRAIYLALDIGMNLRTFADLENSPVMAECWRRTYWGCYVVDGAFSMVQHAPNFMLNTAPADVGLPCEEYDYEGIIPRPRSLTEYDARDFEDESPVFSSFTYLIDLTRIVGEILYLKDLVGTDLELAVGNADAMLMNWQLHLPKEKRGIIDRNEDVDELLFHAHGLYQCLQVRIHRPLSRLYHSPIEEMSICAPPPPKGELDGEAARNIWMHTRKTLDSAEAAIALYSLPSPLLGHSPLGICAISASILAQLSACAYFVQGNEWKTTRDRIRLGLGCLKGFGEVWSTSRRTERETKAIARAVFSSVAVGSGSPSIVSRGSGPVFDYGGRGGIEGLNLGLAGFETSSSPEVHSFDHLGAGDLEYLGLMQGFPMNQVDMGI
ncbi:C6 transcription factor [Phlyctema vagabunda]|uniref:C6 transcription factor n=1 Tax=Phlyctema vagabunda TaxID=108571 RepID=A0ABR4PPZ0_9HELO